ncbi:hypothetical protein PBAL39_03524 [Pedobacter sp. BAL39]|nr:hypothetical protein PBAL39_03524 [Pedobacter sp. BAL39]
MIKLNDMKKYMICFLLICSSISEFSCKKFLDVEPLDKLTGNNFYKTKGDVEAVINDMARMHFEKLNETQVVGAVGEYRSGEVKYEPTNDLGTRRQFVEVLGRNEMIDIVTNSARWTFYDFARITRWTRYYQIIQSANILIYNLEQGVEALTAAEIKQYIGEAKFARCLAYYNMVHLFGDVPYYTNAFAIQAIGRENMVSVFNKCIADLKSSMNDMPWTFSDPALKGVRASRGSAIALIMNMNMWNAGFDQANASKYWRETADLGGELVRSRAFRLIPLAEWATVAKGRSDESLFELFRTTNYGDAVSNWAPFADMFLRYPYKLPQSSHQVSSAFYKAEYMEKIYPNLLPDGRKEAWFESMYANSGEFMVLKYAGNTFVEGGEENNPDNTFMVFRYAESILLRAEALANLGEEDEAITMLNLVRARAKAPSYDGSGGQPLKDFIFLERARELFGEGHYYFDLIRTRRILSRSWTSNSLSLDQFNRGGWTWPIDADATRNNPYMVLNTYWLNGGK